MKASCEQLEQDYLKWRRNFRLFERRRQTCWKRRSRKALEDLNFEQVQFEIHLRKERIFKDGIDDAEFRISLNQGQQVKPLTEVASGGELSRIMLAIKKL